MSDMQATVEISGTPYSLGSLFEDIEAAKKLGLSNQWAFCPETVEALLGYIVELQDCLTDEVLALRHTDEESESEKTFQMCMNHNLTI